MKDESELIRLGIKDGGEDIPNRGSRCTKDGGGGDGLLHNGENFICLDQRVRKDVVV